MLAAVSDVVVAAPVAFGFGILVGLLAASRWRIVRRPDPPRATPSGVWEVPDEMREDPHNRDT